MSILHTPPAEYDDLYERALTSLEHVKEGLRSIYENVDYDRAARLVDPIGARLETHDAVDWQLRQLRDLAYLLAVADAGATAVSLADVGGASKQAHWQRRNDARDRLGLLNR